MFYTWTQHKKLLIKYTFVQLCFSLKTLYRSYSDIILVTTSPILFILLCALFKEEVDYWLPSPALSCWHILLYQLLFISMISLYVCVQVAGCCFNVVYVCMCVCVVDLCSPGSVCVCDLSLLGDLSDGLLSRVSWSALARRLRTILP